MRERGSTGSMGVATVAEMMKMMKMTLVGGIDNCGHDTA